MNIEKFNEAVKALEDACPDNMDFAEVIGVMVDDIADLYRAKDSKEFIKQKKDARNTLKAISKMLSNVTFKNRDKQ